jgi:Tol biopolymer transport system component
MQEVSSNPNLGSAQLDFSSTGTLAYRTGLSEGLRTAQWMDGNGKTESLGTPPAFYLFPRLSPDGARLALLVSQGASTDLWVYDLQQGRKTRLTNGVEDMAYPLWSPDGQFVVFHSAQGMYWTRADGAGKLQPLTQSKNMQLPTSFTPDGARLAFSELTSGTASEIRTMPVERESGQMRGGATQLFLSTSTANAFAAFSPDGRWMAYGDAEAGSYEVYVRAFPDNGAKVQISSAGGAWPLWSRTGHQLFFRTEDQRIMVASYSVKGDTFLAGRPRVWLDKQLANVGLGGNFDLAPDGKRFVALMPAEGAGQRETQNHVTLVVNFLDEVRRRLAPQGK